MKPLRLLIMVLIFLGGAIATGLTGPNRSAIRQTYALSESAFGAGIAAVQIAGAVGVFLLGTRLQRLSPVRVLIGAVAVQVAGFLAIALTRDLAGLVGGWALVSIGMRLGGVANNISMDLWPADPRRGIVLLHSFNAGGKVTGPLVAAACLAVGWRWSFATFGAATLAVLAMFLALRRRCEAVYAAPAPAPRAAGRAFASPRYWLFVAGLGMIAGGEAAFASLAPEYFEKVRGTSAQVGTLLLTVHLLGLVAGRFVSAFFGGRASNRTVIALCLAAGVFVFPAVLARPMPIAAVSLFLFGVMFSSTWPSFYALASGWLAEHRDMMPYGASLGTVVGISLGILASSVIAQRDLTLSLLFGPAVLWLFGLAFFASRLSRPAPPAGAGAAAAER